MVKERESDKRQDKIAATENASDVETKKTLKTDGLPTLPFPTLNFKFRNHGFHAEISNYGHGGEEATAKRSRIPDLLTPRPNRPFVLLIDQIATNARMVKYSEFV